MRTFLIAFLIAVSICSYGQDSIKHIHSIAGVENNFPKRKNGFYLSLNHYVRDQVAHSPNFKLKMGSAKLELIVFPKKSKPSAGQVYRNTACVVLNDTLYIKSRKYKKSYMKVLVLGKLSLVPFNPASDVWVPVLFTPLVSITAKVNHSSSFGTLFNLKNGHYFNFTPYNFRRYLLENDMELYKEFKEIENPTLRQMIPFLLAYNKKHRHIFK